MSDSRRCDIVHGSSEEFLRKSISPHNFDLTFLDPPFNQGKDYESHDDDMPDEDYWAWMTRVCKLTLENTSEGGAMYFMQREKNAERVLCALREAGWTFQNLIVWKKKTSAVPNTKRYGLHYQIIAFCTKGKRARVFNKLRINPPLMANERIKRKSGVFVTDVWDDIRELTSGYFAGDEPFRLPDGERAHKQQSPVQLLSRILLSSTKPGDFVFDPFAGTGTTLIVAKQLQRGSLGVELDLRNYALIRSRLEHLRPSDNIEKFRRSYLFTKNLDEVWPSKFKEQHFELERFIRLDA